MWVLAGPGDEASQRVVRLLAPADLLGLGDVDALDAVDWLVGDQRHAGVEELQSRAHLRLLTARLELRDGLDTKLSHLGRVLLRGGADDAALDRFDARA